MRKLTWLVLVLGCDSTPPGMNPDLSMIVESNPDLLTSPDLLAGLTISPTDDDFGMVAVGGSGNTHIFTVTSLGSSGALTVNVGGAQAGEFTVSETTCGAALMPAGTCTVSVGFAPTALGARTATLDVGDGTISVTATLKGAGIDPAQLSATPASQPFGPVVVNAFSGEATITINNGGDQDSGLLTVMLTGADAVQFLITDKPCDGASLPMGGSCAIKMKFHPISSGSKSASLEITASPGGRVVVPLTGSGAVDAALTLTSPAQPSLDYGDIATAGTSTLSVTVTNSGGVTSGAITTALSGPDEARFVVTQACGALAPAASCTILIAFNPNAQSNFTADLDISGAPGGTVTINLIGTGAAPAALAITGDLSFGRVAKGATSAEQLFTVTNSGGVSTGAPVAAILQGADVAMFTITSNTCNLALAAGAKCKVKATFNPPGNATVGDKSTTLHVTAPAAALPADATLAGRAVNQATLSITPAGPVDFGTVILGGSPALPVLLTVTNTGGVSTPTGLHVELSDSTNFSLTLNNCENVTLTTTPGTNACTVTVGFTPTTNGTLTTTLSVSFDLGGALEATETKNLKGIAQSPAALAWKPLTRNYGKLRVGANGPYKSFTLTNTGDVTTQPIAITETGNLTSFDLDRNPSPSPCGVDGFTLAGGASCSVQQRFSPNVVGARTLTMKADDTAVNSSAVLNGNGAWRLIVAKAGTGSGTVNSSDTFISCGADCAELYTVDQTQVTLTASPVPTSTFNGWINCSPSPSPTCIAVMDANKTATATFTNNIVTLSYTKSGVGTGTVQSFVNGVADGQINCGSGCTSDTATYSVGTVVELRASPDSMNALQQWGGACSGYGLCQVQMTSDQTVTAALTPINKAFVTSMSYAADFGSVDAADAKCAAAAAAANLGGTTWKALISDATHTAKDRFFASTARGWVRMDGLPVIDRMSDTFSSYRYFYPLAVDENGAAVAKVSPWTGTSRDGSSHTNTCNGWKSTDGGDFGLAGNTMGGGGFWCQSNNQSCSSMAPLFCFQLDYQAPIVLPAAPAGARHAFLSSAGTATRTGIGAFDQHCRDAAAAAALANASTYKALVAGVGSTAASRFSAGTWYRVDQVKLFTLADLQANVLPTATLDVSETLSTPGSTHQAMVGAIHPNIVGDSSNTCSDWMNGSSAVYESTVGYPSLLDNWFTSNQTACSASLYLYCLEDQ